MGTRGLVNVQNEQGNTILTLYRQYDCYPTGMGQDLLDILGESNITNGFNGSQAAPAVFNGFGCMAAYLVKQLKEGIGNVYVEAPDTNDVGEEFTYTLYPNNKQIYVKVVDVWNDNRTLYDGPISDLNPKALEEGF